MPNTVFSISSGSSNRSGSTSDDRLFVSAPGIYAVEDYLQARYYMFRQVYFHRTLRSAEAVLKSLSAASIVIFATGGDIWFRPGTAFEKVLRGERLTSPNTFRSTIPTCFSISSNGNPPATEPSRTSRRDSSTAASSKHSTSICRNRKGLYLSPTSAEWWPSRLRPGLLRHRGRSRQCSL